jgi:MTH538 TIR-like domain (DUF1863)
MARRVFFSFHYQRDIFRINQIRSIPNITGTSAAGFQDASLWEESKKKGRAAIEKMIDDALFNTTVTVVCIGSQTAGRQYVNYEIEKSIARGNGVIGIQIAHLIGHDKKADAQGATPKLLTDNDIKIYKYVDHEKLAARIEEAAKAAGK